MRPLTEAGDGNERLAFELDAHGSRAFVVNRATFRYGRACRDRERATLAIVHRDGGIAVAASADPLTTE